MSYEQGQQMKIKVKDFRVNEGKKVSLNKLPTKIEPFYTSTEQYQKFLAEKTDELSSLQYKFYADKTYSMLLIFQGIDTAGKDNIIRHVMSGVDPQGCQVFRFEQPSVEELKHDFLWRTTCRLPQRGRIGIFNRSYYEEVLVVRVHPEILQNQGLPEELVNKKKIWHERYESINNFEKHLTRNGTKIIKFFLHLSKEEQRNRFLSRIDEPEKNWKFSQADIDERGFWKNYMHAYQDCINATSTERAPWYIIPADDKENARLIVSTIICENLKKLNPDFPEVTDDRIKELKKIRKFLVK